MDWSAALSLRTSRERQHTPNYGSFRAYAAPLGRGAGHPVMIPESIPEDESVVIFKSPQLRRELHEQPTEPSVKSPPFTSYGFMSPSAAARRHGASPRPFSANVGISAFSKPAAAAASTNDSASTGTKSTAAAERAKAFKLWQATDKQKRIDEIMKGTAGTPFALNKAKAKTARTQDPGSSHWMQERERMRLQRMLRLANAREAEEEVPMPNWKVTAIMCSVPFVLMVVFFVLVILLGKDARRAALAKMHIIHAAEMEVDRFANPQAGSAAAIAASQHLPDDRHALRSLAPLARDIARAITTTATRALTVPVDD